MPQFPAVEFIPVKDLAALSVSHPSPKQLLCRWQGGGLFSLQALAPNLFRLRITRKESFPADHSWAVIKKDWPECSATIHKQKNKIELATNEARFSLDLKTGSWTLHDRYGLEIFRADPLGAGFSSERAKVTLRLQPGEQIFGLGETTGTFNKRGLLREFWNIDVLGHSAAIHPSLRMLYVSIPFGISLRNGRAGGIFWDNTHRQSWNMGQTDLDLWRMEAAHGDIDLYLFTGPTIAGIVQTFSELTGRMRMPPKWALGYQQCRYSYETQEKVEEIARAFRQKQIPCDVIYLDIHHMNEYRVFTFGPAFPKPSQMLKKLKKQGFKTVAIVDPGVKDDPQFSVFQNGREIRAFVKQPNGKLDYKGKVWPGVSRFPDFTRQAVRDWWSQEQSAFQKLGLDGFWNDMNEPADFSGPGKTLPEKCVHQSDTGPLLHQEAHNIYGMQMAKASQEGALMAEPDKRPFIISRAGYAGVQRHAMIWTGDNSSWWEHLDDAIQMFLNLSLSGVPFCGGDVGGFLDNTTGELLARWTQFAAFTPFFRNHSNIRTRDQEPWSFGPEVENVCRNFIQLRYQLLPYLYGLFAEAQRTGTPIMRPMSWHYQNDPVAVSAGDQFLLGESLLVAPILRQGAEARSVYLPVGQWYDFWNDELLKGGKHVLALAPLERMPLYVRAGSIIPFSPLQQFIGERSDDFVTLNLWPGRSGNLGWYEDDSESNAYQNNDYARRSIRWIEKNRSGKMIFEPVEGFYRSQVKTWRIVIHNMAKTAKVKINGKPAESEFNAEMGLAGFAVPNAEGEIVVDVRGI
ncbi:MAG: TIM-barrel domain-containing protein [Verrucomicrobiales bacterium]